MLLWFFPFKRALLWTLATAPCVHAFPYLFLSSAPKGALPGPAADSPTRPRVSQLTALTQTGDLRPTQGEAMSTAMPTKVPLSPPRGSGSQHTQAWRRPRAPGHSYLPQKSWRRLCRAGRSLCPALCHRQGHAEPTAAAHTTGRMCARFTARLALTGPCPPSTTSRFTQLVWAAPAGARAASSGASATHLLPTHDAWVTFLAECSEMWTGPPSWQPAATRG